MKKANENRILKYESEKTDTQKKGSALSKKNKDAKSTLSHNHQGINPWENLLICEFRFERP